MYKALSGSVIVKLLKQDRKTDGGIILTGVAMSTPHDVLTVEVVSQNENDDLFVIGDKVLVAKHHLTKLSEVEQDDGSVIEFYSSKVLSVIAVID